MHTRHLKYLLLAAVSAGAVMAAADANAGGFAVREQSAYGQGSSYAGVAAGGSLSTMFWNPATMTQQPGMQSESVVSGILPYAANTVGAGSVLPLVGIGVTTAGTGNTGLSAVVPSGYFSYQINPQTWVGLSVNAPYGLAVSFPNVWAGRDYAAGSTSLKTYNFAPSLAYKFSDMISVGVGMQIQYGKASLTKGPSVANPAPPPPFLAFFPEVNLNGDGWAYGFTAGVTLTPTPTTTIGIGYRSALNQKISGNITADFPLPAPSTPTISTTLNLPGTLSVGLKQKLDPQWTLLGTVEWTNWSRIGTSTSGVTIAGNPVQIAFQYKDGWFVSLGAEYQWTDALAVRAGLAYEKSPITDQVRIPLLPDNDRYWASVGATYKITNKLSADLAYSHVFVKSTPINVVAGNPNFDGVAYVGTVDSHIDIISVGIKYRWDDPAPVVKQRYAKAK
jgi:long-chain fatty acid transport protein